jgi:hypothetical protein
MRIRIKHLPAPGEMEEYDLRRFRPGDVYDVPAQLASLLIISGHAEPATARFSTSEAADYGKSRKP